MAAHLLRCVVSSFFIRCSLQIEPIVNRVLTLRAWWNNLFDASPTTRLHAVMILSARDLKVRGVLCALRFVRVVDFSMADAANAWAGLPLSVTLTGVWDGVDFASPSIKRNLNICQGTIDDAVGLFQNITNATLIILENNSTMSCKIMILRNIRLHSPNLLLY